MTAPTRDRLRATTAGGMFTLIASASIVGLSTLPAAAAPGGAHGSDREKVTLCHATGSDTNPYVQITVDPAGAYNGHYRQHEDHGQGDIIPPFQYQGQTYSLNWEQGQAIFDAGCQNPAGPETPHHPVTPDEPQPPADTKVPLCHATGSDTNPYVLITVDAAGAYNGHYRQHEDHGQGDIIPPFQYQGQTYSLNWQQGQAVFDAGCQAPVQPETPHHPEKPHDPGTPADPTIAGNPAAPGDDGGVAAGPKAPASATAETGTAAQRESEVGPIPRAADAGRAPTSTWQLPAGLALAGMGALTGGVAFYRRMAAGS